MRVVIIGGTGRVGTFLVPRLVMDGYEVICVSRQKSKPYRSHSAWKFVTNVAIDRTKAEEKHLFGKQIAKLNPDVIIDMICFTLGSAKCLAEALMGQIQHFLHCGTLWVHGHSERVPTRESQPRNPFGEYGIQKAAIESYLLSLSRRKGFPATILHPGHITGPAGCPSILEEILIPVSSTDWRRAKKLYYPILAWRRFIMYMPMMWPRHL